MDAVERYEQIEERLEEAFRRERFDTFAQLMAERLSLLQLGGSSAAGAELFAAARQKTQQWILRLTERIQKEQLRRQQTQRLHGGYRPPPRAGRRINRHG